MFLFVCCATKHGRVTHVRARGGGAGEKNTWYLEVLTGDDAGGSVCLLVTVECVCLSVSGRTQRSVCVMNDSSKAFVTSAKISQACAQTRAP